LSLSGSILFLLLLLLERQKLRVARKDEDYEDEEELRTAALTAERGAAAHQPTPTCPFRLLGDQE
jgi:hypothetical protein